MADISKITLPNGSSYNIKDATARNSKTNTSVLPNDGGEIKTKFRMSQMGFTNGATWYYPLCKFPKDNDGNYASAILSGRVGGWTSNNMSSITSLIWNRGSSDIALLDIAGSANTMSRIWSVCDIVVYTNSDTTDTVYLKCNGYFTFDIDIELFQSGCAILYNGSYVTTTPSGTLTASASTSTKRAELINGKLYVAGNELAFTSAIPTKTSQLTNDSGFKTTDTNTTYSLSKSGSTITLTGSDGKTTSVTDSDTTYTLPVATSSTLGGVKTGSNITNSSGTISLTKANVTAALGYTPPTTNTTYGVATQSANGLMSSSDKTKLDGIATGANKTTVDSALSSTSTNPVQNKVINSALAGKAAASHTHTTQSAEATSDANASYLRQIATGTAEVTTTNCPNGCLYGQYS